MEHLDEIIEWPVRLERLLADALHQLQADPDELPWRTMAVKLSITGKDPATTARRRAHRARNAGAVIRGTRHGVNSRDFSSWLSNCDAQHVTQADRVQRTLAGVYR